jgi:hypothetical protein
MFENCPTVPSQFTSRNTRSASPISIKLRMAIYTTFCQAIFILIYFGFKDYALCLRTNSYVYLFRSFKDFNESWYWNLCYTITMLRQA